MAKKISVFICMLALSIIGLLTFLVTYSSPKCGDNVECIDVVESTGTEPIYCARPALLDIANVWCFTTDTSHEQITSSSSPTTDTQTTTETTTTYTTATTKPEVKAVPVRTTTYISTTTGKTTTCTTTTTNSLTQSEVYVVYKPATHYIHKSTCKWFDKTCVRIDSTDGLECRKCSKCNPDMLIIKQYVPPVDDTKYGNYDGVTSSEIVLLQKLVQNEYGADWVSVQEKAKIVASIMCQVKDKRFPNTVTKCIYKSCVPYGFNPNKYRKITDSVKKAVQYYFDNRYTVFKNWTANSWYGDGKRNHFYKA